MLHDHLETLVFGCQRSWWNPIWLTPLKVPNACGVGKVCYFQAITSYISKTVQDNMVYLMTKQSQARQTTLASSTDCKASAVMTRSASFESHVPPPSSHKCATSLSCVYATQHYTTWTNKPTTFTCTHIHCSSQDLQSQFAIALQLPAARLYHQLLCASYRTQDRLWKLNTIHNINSLCVSVALSTEAKVICSQLQSQCKKIQ